MFRKLMAVGIAALAVITGPAAADDLRSAARNLLGSVFCQRAETGDRHHGQVPARRSARRTGAELSGGIRASAARSDPGELRAGAKY